MCNLFVISTLSAFLLNSLGFVKFAPSYNLLIVISYLLGLQALLIYIALCFARDEVYWLLRHNDNPPQQKSKGKSAEDLVDRQLPELLFHMEELRGERFKYS